SRDAIPFEAGCRTPTVRVSASKGCSSCWRCWTPRAGSIAPEIASLTTRRDSVAPRGRMLDADPLLERESALRQVRGVLASVGRGAGHVLLIEGDAGIGKTALLRAAALDAERMDMQVLSARGGVLERSLGHGVARDLFEPAVARAPAARRR